MRREKLITMDFTDKELINLYKAINILENGEVLLGVDIEKKVVEDLNLRLEEQLSRKVITKINQEIKTLIREAEIASYDYMNDTIEDDFDREFGPSYPTRETLKILNRAIQDDRCANIDYYSLSSGGFTTRRIKPVEIERKGGKAYLNAFCYLRNEDRVFRISRIKSIEECD